MKAVWSREFDLPLVLIIITLGLPCVALGFMPDVDFFGIDWNLWLASGIYLGGAVAVIRFTSGKLVKVDGDISTDKGRHILVQASVNAGEQLIMGIGLLGIPWGAGPQTFDEGLLFVSIRWGLTLVLLGGFVLVFANQKMSNIQGR